MIGRRITLEERRGMAEGQERSCTVVGVLPPDLHFLEYGAVLRQFTLAAGDLRAGDIDVWKPLTLIPEKLASRDEINALRGAVIARLKPGVTGKHAQAELNLIADQLGREHPRRHERTFQVAHFRERVVASVRPALWVLLGAGGLVLLIACANIANMLLARSLGRRREVAVRLALGAGRLRLVRQFLTESLLLSLAGGASGVLLTAGSFGVMRAALPSDIPRLSEVQIDVWVLCFALLVSVATGTLVGLTPAFRISVLGTSQALKGRGLAVCGGSYHSALRRALVVSQVALSLTLLIGAGLMIRSFWRLTRVDLGFDPSHVLLVGATSDFSIYKHPEPYFRALAERIEQLPGIEAAAFGPPPFSGPGVQGAFDIAGRAAPADGEKQFADFVNVSEDYFIALRIPLRMGRAFTRDDHADAEPVVIVNETIAHRCFPGASPIGQVLTCGGKSRRIVGVAGDVHPNGFRSDALPTIYFPLGQTDWGVTDVHVIVRARGTPESLFEPVHRQLLALNPRSPVRAISTFEKLLGDQVTPARFNMRLLSLFGALALVLTSAGLYGLTAFFVSQRTQEIGIRMALGARSVDVFKSIVGQGIKLTLIGTGIGLAGAFALSRFITSLLYEISPTDPLTFVFVPLVLVAVAVVASYLPARRATRIDPMVALRYE
jgi:putative ABC transport system permease protein